MMRDSNNIKGALDVASSMGRGGDDQMAHVGTGEIMIPPEVIDNYPQILPQVVKAFQNAGLDWRKYMAGQPENSKNPSTGAPEFKYGADTNEGGMSGYDPGERDGKDPGFDAKDMMTHPLSPLGYGLEQAGKHLFSGEGYTPPGGMAQQAFNNSLDRGDRMAPTQMAPSYTPPPLLDAPSYLGFSPEMTDLQKRAQIATFGLNASDSRYTSDEVKDYYRGLLANNLAGATDISGVLPIEQQYLSQVLGVNATDLPGLQAGLSI